MSLHFLFFSPPQGLANRPRSEHDRPWMSFPELTGEARLLNPDGSLLWSQLTSPAAFLARSQHTIHFQTLSAVASQWNCWLCHIIARLMGGGSAHLQFLPPHAASNISPLWLFLVGGGGGLFPSQLAYVVWLLHPPSADPCYCVMGSILTSATVWWNFYPFFPFFSLLLLHLVFTFWFALVPLLSNANPIQQTAQSFRSPRQSSASFTVWRSLVIYQMNEWL